jgi:hypothetical protein
MIMKNFRTLLLLLLTIASANAAKIDTPESSYQTPFNGKAYIFIEGGVEFSVFTDGQFDFVYLDTQQSTMLSFNTPSVFLSFNAGRDYEAYLQYDDYGAIIQIEDVPVYYDVYRRIIKAGEVEISYINSVISRIGGLQIFYNRYGDYDYYTGYINSYNRFYTYRPWHLYYLRPMYNNCIIWDIPYRRFYMPIRYSYYNHLRYYNNRATHTYTNARREFISPGSRIYYRNGSTALNTRYKRGRKNNMITGHGRIPVSTRAAITRTNRVKNASVIQNNTNTPRTANRTRNRIATVSQTSSPRIVYTTPSKRPLIRSNSARTSTRRNTYVKSTSRNTKVVRTPTRRRRL